MTARHDQSRWAFASVALVFVALVPLLSGLAMALAPEGRDALAAWWARPAGWRILWSSLLFAATGASVALVAGWAIALLLPASGAPRQLVLTLCCLPLLVPSSLMGVGWIMALGRDAVVTNALRHVFGDAVPTIYAWPLAAAATGLRYVGAAVLVLALARRDGATSRAAERAFALPWWTRARLRAGATRSAAVAAWLLLLLLVQSDHILPGMFLVHTFGTELLIQFNALMDPAGAAALAAAPAVIALAVVVACGAILPRAPWSHGEDAGDAGSAATVESTVAASRAVLTIALILLIAVGIPLTGLIVRAQSFANLRDAWAESLPEVGHSVRLALLGAMATVLLAVPLAHAWVAAQRQGCSSPAPLVLLNLAVPGSLLAVGILFLPVPRALADTNGALVLAYAARFVAVAVIVLFAAWMRRSASADVAARVHGVPAVDHFLRLTLPVRLPAVLAALFLVALLVAAELEMSLILVRPGPTTLGVRLYTLIHTAPDHVVAALAVDVLMAVMLAAVAFVGASWVVARSLGRRRIA